MPDTTTVKRILISDPDEKSRAPLAQFLRDRKMDVVDTADGGKALSETLLKRPDVILLDLSVAVLTADRLVQILRTNPTTRSIPIVFMSEQERNIPGFRPGMDDFIRKPFHEEEVFLRLQRNLFHGNLPQGFSGDSEISGNLAQMFLPDLWQMLTLNQKSGIIQIEAEKVSGSIYIEKGNIVSAVSQNVTGEKALFRMIPLREGRFRFVPGKVDVHRTINTPGQHVMLEGLRQFDELKKLEPSIPAPNHSVVLVKDARVLAGGGGIVREVVLLAEFCTRVEEIVDNCSFPDLAVYQTILQLKERGVLRIGKFDARPLKNEFLPPEELVKLRARMEEGGAFSDGHIGRIILFLPDAALLEEVVRALGHFKEFEMDTAFFSLRREDSAPFGMFGKLRSGEGSHLLLYAFPYIRSTSPLWYALAPHPIGIVAFLKDEVSSSIESLMAVSDYTRGAEAKVVLAVMGKTFTNFGMGENTLRLFQNRIEKLGCSLKVQEMEQLSPEEIREAFSKIVRQYLEGAAQ